MRPEDPNTHGHHGHDAEMEPEPTLSQWLARNGLLLIVFAAGFVYLFSYGGVLGVWNALKVVLGLGFVIFIHELGHFLVAKWCDVNVTTFSIGFGPAIPGCKYKWGETIYMIGIIPLGGYVQMVGQVDLDESGDGADDDPRSYRNKSVWQRMAIISAGVVMNALLAVVCFAVVFLGPGKERQAAVVDMIDPGAPAFKEAIPTGSEILQIGTVKDPYFEDLLEVVMNTVHGEQIEFVYRLPGKEPVSLHIEPRLSEKGGRPLIGMAPSRCLNFVEERALRMAFTDPTGPVVPGSAAGRATPAIDFEDSVIGMSDPDKGGEVTELRKDPRVKKGDQRDFFEFARRLDRLAGKEITLRVLRNDGKTTVDIKIPPAYSRTLGVRMRMGEIVAVRKQSPADDKVLPRNGKREGDVIEAVEVTDAEGNTILYGDKADDKDAKGLPLDPVRLPARLEQWADSLQEAGKTTAEDLTVTLHVRRHRSEPGQQFEKKEIKLVWSPEWRFDRMQPFSPDSPLPIPELGLAYQVKTVVADADEDCLLKSGDVIKRVRFYSVAGENENNPESWVDLGPEQWAWVFTSLQDARVASKVEFEVERATDGGAKQPVTIELQPKEDKTWPRAERGFLWSPDVRLQKVDNFFSAVSLGFYDTYKRMVGVYRNIRGIVIGRISPNNLAGPITIANIAYRFAGYDFWEFLFLIGMISINLAVINFLPIPVLDGGHMVFLIYEKIRGKPASEAIRTGATYAGLALILMLMVFVFYLDIKRLMNGG